MSDNLTEATFDLRDLDGVREEAKLCIGSHVTASLPWVKFPKQIVVLCHKVEEQRSEIVKLRQALKDILSECEDETWSDIEPIVRAALGYEPRFPL